MRCLSFSLPSTHNFQSPQPSELIHFQSFFSINYFILFGFISAVDDLKRQNVQHFCRSLSGIQGYRTPGVSSKKLLDTGFVFKHGLDEMFDGAVQCCKEKGFLQFMFGHQLFTFSKFACISWSLMTDDLCFVIV